MTDVSRFCVCLSYNKHIAQNNGVFHQRHFYDVQVPKQEIDAETWLSITHHMMQVVNECYVPYSALFSRR